jgi:Amt family ammonium transporter
VNAFAGGVGQLGKQAVAVGVTLAFSFVATMAILKAIDMLVGVRVSEDEEVAGLDLSQHSEVGYTFGERGGTVTGSSPTGRAAVHTSEAPKQTVHVAVEPSPELEVVGGEER